MRPSILAALFFLLTTSLHGQSRLIFPRLSFEEVSMTGLAVLNPNEMPAQIVFTYYDSEGQIVAAPGFENPRLIEIPAGRQFAQVASEIFRGTPPLSTGWIEAASTASGLTGFFLYFDFPAFTFFDGADLPSPATRLTFSEIRLGGGMSTEINLVNPGSLPVNLQLELEGGSREAPNLLTIPAKGVRRLDVAELFEGSLPQGEILPDSAVLQMEANQPVAGFAFVRQIQGDLLGLNAVSSEPGLNRLYFPQFAVGAGIRTELLLNNGSAQSALVTIRVHRESGRLFGPPEVAGDNPTSTVLVPGQVLRLDLADFFGFNLPAGTLLEGWVEVQSSSPALRGSVSYFLPGTGALASVSTAPAGLIRAAFSHLATSGGFFTGIALLNPGAAAANVRVLAIDPAGQILGNADVVLGPGQRIARLLGGNLIPEAQGQAGGFVFVRSSSPIHLTSLFGRLTEGGVLANIPAQSVPPGFRPDAELTPLRIDPFSGSVALNGEISFQVENANSPPLWTVEGVPGGAGPSGMITPAGDYRAPFAAPLRQPVTIAATVDSRATAAWLDIYSRQTLADELGVLQSVTFLDGLSRLFVAELVGTGGASASTAQEQAGSLILDVTGGERNLVQEFPAEELSKILGYRRSEGRFSLLAAGRSSGRIFRLDLDEPVALRVIASGLDSPVAMAVDSFNGDLIVAEATRLSRIPAASLISEGISPQGALPVNASILDNVRPGGVEVDGCTGDIFFSDRLLNSIRRFDRASGLTSTVAELTDPTQIVGIFRAGVSCPEGFHLFAAEPILDQVTRVFPSEGTALPYAETPGIQDVAFLATATQDAEDGLLAAERIAGAGQVEQFVVPGVYEMEGMNPPIVSPSLAEFPLPFLDDVESGAENWTAVGSLGAATWQIVDAQASSPTHSWMAQDLDTPSDQRLTLLRPITIPDGGFRTVLSFAHRYQFEEGFDGGVLEYSTDGGNTWIDAGDLMQGHTYSGFIGFQFGAAGGKAAPAGIEDNPLIGEVFSGTSPGFPDFVRTSVDFSSLAGARLQFRFRVGTDFSVGAEGWFVDDIEVITFQPGSQLFFVVDTGANLREEVGADLSGYNSALSVVNQGPVAPNPFGIGGAKSIYFPDGRPDFSQLHQNTLTIENRSPDDAVEVLIHFYNDELVELLGFLTVLPCSSSLQFDPLNFMIPGTSFNTSTRLFGPPVGTFGPVRATDFASGRILVSVTAVGTSFEPSNNGVDDDIAELRFSREFADLVSESHACRNLRDETFFGTSFGFGADNLTVFNASAVAFNQLIGRQQLGRVGTPDSAVLAVPAQVRRAVDRSAADQTSLRDQPTGDGQVIEDPADEWRILTGSEALTDSSNVGQVAINNLYLENLTYGGDTGAINDFNQDFVVDYDSHYGALGLEPDPDRLPLQRVHFLSLFDDYDGLLVDGGSPEFSDRAYLLRPARSHYVLRVLNRSADIFDGSVPPRLTVFGLRTFLTDLPSVDNSIDSMLLTELGGLTIELLDHLEEPGSETARIDFVRDNTLGGTFTLGGNSVSPFAELSFATPALYFFEGNITGSAMWLQQSRVDSEVSDTGSPVP